MKKFLKYAAVTIGAIAAGIIPFLIKLVPLVLIVLVLTVFAHEWKKDGIISSDNATQAYCDYLFSYEPYDFYYGHSGGEQIEYHDGHRYVMYTVYLTDDGSVTRDEIYSLMSEHAKRADEIFGGEPTQLYVGHGEGPDMILGDKQKIVLDRWTISFYKKCRSDTKM